MPRKKTTNADTVENNPVENNVADVVEEPVKKRTMKTSKKVTADTAIDTAAPETAVKKPRTKKAKSAVEETSAPAIVPVATADIAIETTDEGKQVVTVTNVEPLTTADPADTADTPAPAISAQTSNVKPPKRTVKAKKDTTTFTTILQVGDKEFDITNIAENALKAYKSVHKRKNVTDFVVYVKPEENAAYYTVNGEGSEEYKVEL